MFENYGKVVFMFYNNIFETSVKVSDVAFAFSFFTDPVLKNEYNNIIEAINEVKNIHSDFGDYE